MLYRLSCVGFIIVSIQLIKGKSEVVHDSNPSPQDFNIYDQGSVHRNFPFEALNSGFISNSGYGINYANPFFHPSHKKYHQDRLARESFYLNTIPHRRVQMDNCRCGFKPRKERHSGRFRVVGGHLGKYKRPWYTYLQITSKRQNKKKIKFECGGALINYQYILTAAHCICKQEKKDRKEDEFCLDSNPIIRVNSYSVKTMKALIGESNKYLVSKQGREIDLYIVHEEWIANSNQHFDIALLRLKDRIEKFTYRIQPICLPTSPKIIRTNFHGQLYKIDYSKISVVAGFGHLVHSTNRKVKCHTDDRLPRPFHTCKSPCHTTNTPSYHKEECQEVYKLIGKNNYEKGFQENVGAIAVWDSYRQSFNSCFPFQSGSHGWCSVYSNLRSDKIFTELKNSSWGFCSKIELHLIEPRECEEILKSVVTSSESKKVFERNEFCAGIKHVTKIINYETELHGNGLRLSHNDESKFQYIGGGDTCAGDSGSPILAMGRGLLYAKNIWSSDRSCEPWVWMCFC
ncbi:unnamed protein product [Lepeophtheirus salmonis]|uniref:(salmon louse) hypothetical protein n=1 Tax=Lepeophtheirus salmonis TaxID=72036 RepID=A0A7R8H755_LEPSM|nr:unnamed protein product [Lepeophtheirus salmonis]CAF2895655.1 unnamed protein product [Lepeophtheirus salmonis]